MNTPETSKLADLVDGRDKVKSATVVPYAVAKAIIAAVDRELGSEEELTGHLAVRLLLEGRSSSPTLARHLEPAIRTAIQRAVILSQIEGLAKAGLTMNDLPASWRPSVKIHLDRMTFGGDDDSMADEEPETGLALQRSATPAVRAAQARSVVDEATLNRIADRIADRFATSIADALDKQRDGELTFLTDDRGEVVGVTRVSEEDTAAKTEQMRSWALSDDPELRSIGRTWLRQRGIPTKSPADKAAPALGALSGGS